MENRLDLVDGGHRKDLPVMSRKECEDCLILPIRELPIFLRLVLLGCLPAVAQQTTFDFHSNLCGNLHHFYEQAISKSPEPSDSPDWQHAVEVYRSDSATHELLSREIAGINIALSQVESN